MSGLTLLAIGGPKHCEQLPWQEGRNELVVPIMSKLTAAFDDRWCVHGGHIISRYDGDRRPVPVDTVARLYGLRPHEWRRSPTNGSSPQEAYERARQHPLTDRCLFPDPSGVYRLPWATHAVESTITVARYYVRVIGGAAVYVYVGN